MKMGSNSSNMCGIYEVEKLMEETGFSRAHIQRLHTRFCNLDRESKGYLSPQDFGEIKELAMNPIGDWIIRAFFSAERDSVDFSTFLRILAHFRPVDEIAAKENGAINSATSKLRFAFQLYDQDQDGKISREELLKVLRAMLGKQVTEEHLQSLAERAMQEGDLDGDDAFSFDEFRKSLEKVNIDHKMSIRFLR